MSIRRGFHLQLEAELKRQQRMSKYLKIFPDGKIFRNIHYILKSVKISGDILRW